MPSRQSSPEPSDKQFCVRQHQTSVTCPSLRFDLLSTELQAHACSLICFQMDDMRAGKNDVEHLMVQFAIVISTRPNRSGTREQLVCAGATDTPETMLKAYSSPRQSTISNGTIRPCSSCEYWPETAGE